MLSTTLVSSLPAVALSLGPPNVRRLMLAKAEANKLLALAPLPPGSQPRTTQPPSDGNPLLVGITQTAVLDEVSLTAYTVVPPRVDVYNWLLSRSPTGSHLSGGGSSGGSNPGTYVSSVDFTFKGTSVLPGPGLGYTFGVTPSGEIEVRIDVTVQWYPQKSLSSVVSAGAAQVVVVVNRGTSVNLNPLSRVRNTNPATVGQILTKVNTLEPIEPTIPSTKPVVCMCGIASNSTMTLRFFRAGAPRPYAIATANAAGDAVVIHQYSPVGALIGTGRVAGGYNLITWVAKKLGIHHPIVASLP
jgi:hypothetical protein